MKILTLGSRDGLSIDTIVEIVDTKTRERKVVGYLKRATFTISSDFKYGRMYVAFIETGFSYQERIDSTRKEVEECENVEILTIEEFDHRFM